MFLLLEETKLGLELASQSDQWIIQEESHTIGLLSSQKDKYETFLNIYFLKVKKTFSKLIIM